jgi:hypothetical protein
MAMNEDTLFHEAVAKSADERAAFLNEACAGRPEVRAAVEARLTAHEQRAKASDVTTVAHDLNAHDAPTEPADLATAEFTPEPGDTTFKDAVSGAYQPAARPGAVIAGRYTLVEKIGEGGMGEVWFAKQTEPVKRNVALKLIQGGMGSRAVLQRFEQERQALALMDHPNIARVFDGGLAPTGQPFFVMELVSGLPLTKFCDEARLTPKARLELFVPICHAVQHAHQKGIVHRDLKPANILVAMIDGRPVPKIIDFGVAKATGDKLLDESPTTQFGAIVGTLEYMSPEQAGFTGEDVDTRADIYALGVILYELVTGLRPIDAKRLKKAALTEMIRIIREEEPSKPSTRLSTDASAPSMAALRQTEPRKLAALLRGELDWVVMKCLEKQRERRYETASRLARDIERYLANEVVEARPPSARYRLRKFIVRNRGAVLAAALVTFAVVAGAIGIALQWREAVHERNRAERARAEAQKNSQIAQEQRKVALDAVGKMVTTVRAELLKKPDLQGVLKKVLDIAQSSLDKIALNPLVDVSLNDTTRAAAHDATARMFRDLGDTPAALAEFHKAATIYRTILGQAAESPEKEVVKKNLVIVLISLGQTSLRTGSQADARGYYEQAKLWIAKLDNKLAIDYLRLLLDLYRNLGISTIDKQPREARETYLRASRIAEELADRDTAETGHPSDGTRENLVRLYLLLGGAAGRLRDAKSREEYNSKALVIAEAMLTAQPSDNGRKKVVALAHERIGDSLLRTTQAAGASEQFVVAAKLYKEIAESDPKNVDAQADRARILYSQGLAALRKGDKNASAEYWKDSLAIRSDRINLKSETYAQRDLMMSFAQVGRHREAVELAETVRTKLPKDPGALVDIACCYAVCTSVIPGAAGPEKATQDRYVTKALEALKQAVHAGYGDKVNLETEPDLDAIRGQAEFQATLNRLPEP